jgi:hypothetical protein
MKRKRVASGINDAGGPEKPIKLFQEKTGRQLFEDAHKEEINKVATERRITEGSGSGKHAGRYQAVLKEKWEALDDKKRQEYEKAAQEHSEDVFQYVKMNHTLNTAYTNY